MTTAILRVGISRKPLQLERAPTFLRFVMVGSDWETLDALDQIPSKTTEVGR